MRLKMIIPKISVIATFYNIEEYVDRCLASITNQTLKEIEIIAVNDGSDDNSLDNICKFAAGDPRIIVINKPNGGVSSARNAGLDIAKGEYIAHIDGDDWIGEQYLETTYCKAEKFKLDIVVTDFFFAHPNGEKIYQKDGFSDDSLIVSGKKYIEQYVENIYAPAIWNKVFARSLYEENKIRYPLGIDLGEDVATGLRLYFFARKIGKISGAYYNYFQRPNSLNRVNLGDKQLRELINIFAIVEEVYGHDMKMLGILNSYKLWFFMDMYLFRQDINPNSMTMREMITDLLQTNKKYPLRYGSRKLRYVAQILRLVPSFYTIILMRFIKNKVMNFFKHNPLSVRR